MIYCTKCGTANTYESNYCINDGFPLHKIKEHPILEQHQDSLSCQSCGADYISNSNYCHTCGETFEKVKSNGRLLVHHKPIIKSLEVKDMKRAFIHTVPLVIVTLVVILFLGFISLGKIDTAPFDYSNIEPELEFVNHYQFFSNYEYNKRNALGEGMMQRDEHSAEQTVDSVLSPIDLLMISNLVNLETTQHNLNVSEEDAVNVTNIKTGIIFYVLLTIITIFIVGMFYSKRKPFEDWKRLFIYATVFSLIYAVSIFGLSLLTTHSTEDSAMNNGSQFTYSFASLNVFWKSFLISFFAIVAGFVFGKGKNLSQSLLSMNVAIKLLIISIVLFSVSSAALYVLYLKDLYVFQSLQRSAIISAPVIVLQVSIVLFNLAFQNVYMFRTSMDEVNLTGYQMISKTTNHSNSNHYMLPEGFFDALGKLDMLLWGLFGVIMLVIVYLSKHFSRYEIKSRLKYIVIFSATFAAGATLLSYGATYNISDINHNHQSSFMLGFSTLRTVLLFFSVTFILSFISSYVFKVKGDS